MKKKITFGLVTFAMVAASAVFMKSIAKDDLSAMIQANVDALAEFGIRRSILECERHALGRIELEA